MVQYFKFKQNDTYGSVDYTLLNNDGTPFNIPTDATVSLYVCDKTYQKLLINKAASVVNNASGLVTYQLQQGDLISYGDFIGEFRVTFSNGQIKSFPQNGYLNLSIEQSINNGESQFLIKVTEIQDFENSINQSISDFKSSTTNTVNGQIARVDNLIESTPQPSEVVDARTNAAGKAFTVLKERLDDSDAQLADIVIDALRLPAPYVSAKGDGISDDTIGIQNGIDYAFNNGFQNVLLPPKQTFLISATLKMKKGVKLISSYLTTIKTTAAVNAIELYDNTSVFCALENIHLDGNGIGLKGVYLNRTDVSTGWDITRFTFKNVFVEGFTSHGVDLGNSTDHSLMEIVTDGLFCYNNGGYGIQSLKATDSFFNNIYLRQNKLGGGYFVTNSNKFNNVKAYANGWSRTDGVSFGLHLEGTDNQFNNIEAQENTGNGIELNALTNSLLELLVDKNGVTSDIGIPATPTYDGLTINNSNNLDIRLSIGDSGYTNLGQYSQRYGFNLLSQCKNIDIKYTAKDVYQEYTSGSTTNNNINIKKVGIEPLTFTSLPATATTNGITFTKISEQLLSMNGTATANAQCQMYGAFGDPTYNKIAFKAGQKIKVSLANKAITGVTFYMVINGSTVAVATNWDSIYIPTSDGYINNIYIQVANGTVLANVLVKPQIIISD